MESTIVMYPSAGSSHLIPMLQLAKQILTHHPSFSVTVIIPIPPPFLTVSTSSYIETFSAANPSITFLHLPSKSLPPEYSPTDTPTLTFEFTRLNNSNLHQALLNLSSNLKINAFVIDFFCNPAFEISSSLNIPTYYFFPSGANGAAAFLYLPTLHNTITQSLKDIDLLIDLPGLPSLPAYNMPMLMLDRNRKAYQYSKEAANQMPKSSGLIINTFQDLEKRAVKAILDCQCTPGESVPPVYCVGPLIELSNSTDDKHFSLSWLDLQPSRSVLFLSFGSMGKFDGIQLKEIAIGLETSGVRFLWVVRPPPTGEPSLELILPEGFLERTKDMGLLVMSWAPQVAILSHDSVGGFVTHCGWNSILEAICAGVPTVAWPLYAEQKLNRAFLVEEIKVALSVAELKDGMVSASELKERVTELMDSEKGKEIRERVMTMRNLAIASVNEAGTSAAALVKLAHSFKNGPVPVSI